MLKQSRKSHPRILILGLVLGAVGAGGAAFGLVVAGNDRIPGAPANTLMPGDPADPPASTPVAHLPEGAERRIGRFRILPVGSVPSYAWVVVPADPSEERGADLQDESQLARAAGDGIETGRATPPLGFKLALSGASWFPPGEGRTTSWLWREYYRYEGAGFFPIEVSLRLATPDGVFDLVDYDSSAGHTWAEGAVKGIQVMYTHGTADAKVQPSMQAFFFLGDYIVTVDSIALPADRLFEVVERFIEDHRARLERASAAARGGVR